MKIILNVFVNIVLLPFYFMMWCLFFLLTWAPVFPSRTGVQNLTQRLGVNRLQASWILSWVFMNYLFCILEMVLFWPLHLEVMLNENQFVEFLKNLHVSSGAALKKVGFAFLGGHLSNFDFLGTVVARSANRAVGNDFYAFAKPSSSMFVTKILSWYREQRKMNMLWTHKTGLVRDTLRAIKGGNNISFLIDQKPEHGGVFVRFCGEYAAFPFAGLDMCLRAQMPIVHVTLRRILPGVHTLIFEEGGNFHLRPDSGIDIQLQNNVWPLFQSEKEKQVSPFLSLFGSWFEKKILENVSQWCWDYKKWSRRPKT